MFENLQKKNLALNKKMADNGILRSTVKQQCILSWIKNSYRLDGGELEESEVKSLMEGNYLSHKTIFDHATVANYEDAVEEIYALASMKDKTDKKIILKIHDKLCGQKSRYRNSIPILPIYSRIPVHYQCIGEEIDGMLLKYYKHYHEANPLARGVFLHNELIRIYPFDEHTQSSARAILNLELIECGFLPLSFEMAEQEYNLAIQNYISGQNEKQFYHMIGQELLEKTEKFIGLQP